MLVASESVQFAQMFLAVIHALICLMKGKVNLTLAAEYKCRDNALNRSYHFSSYLSNISGVYDAIFAYLNMQE